VSNLIVILFNHFSLYLYGIFIVRVMCERECENSSLYWRSSGFCKKLARSSWEANPRSSHVLSTWLECEESWQLGFRECLACKAFPRNTRETFYFAILSFLLYQVFTHTIHTLITHILEEVFFREKTLAYILKN